MAQANKYLCKVIAADGSVVERVVDAESNEVALRMIRQNGDSPIQVSPYVEAGGQDIAKSKIFEKRVKTRDLSIFCRQMNTMLYAGMPLIKAVGVMTEQTEHPVLKKACPEMMQDVQKGLMFSDSMKRQKKYFPKLLVSMVETGELTGKQDEVFGKMALHYEKEYRIERKIKSALLYPKLLAFITTVVLVIMLNVVLPTFVQIFEQGGAELPAITRFVIGVSNFTVSYWYMIAGSILAVVVVFKVITSRREGKKSWQSFLMKLPIVGKTMKQIGTSRFTRTLSTLLTSGLPLLGSLEMAGKVTGNLLIEDGIAMVSEDIKKGSRLSTLIKNVGLFPPMLVSMIAIGEESGTLEDMLERTSDFYDHELEDGLTTLVGLVEPLMIIIMGVIIGFIVVSMLWPMFNLFTAFQKV